MTRIRRRAGTLVELLIALAVTATMLAIALPRTTAALDRAAVHAASRDVETLFAEARTQALTRRITVWLVLDSSSRRVDIRIPGVGTRSRSVGSLYGVAFRTTRDSMSYDARGLGRGAANLTVVLRRGQARDSLVVSRLGRVRR